jgi:hypothetical protein
MVENIMNTANDLYILETTTVADDTRSTQNISTSQALLIRSRLAEQLRGLNDFLGKMQSAKISSK